MIQSLESGTRRKSGFVAISRQENLADLFLIELVSVSVIFPMFYDCAKFFFHHQAAKKVIKHVPVRK